MESSRKNRALYIDNEALSALSMLKDGLLAPATQLANKKKYESIIKKNDNSGSTFPFPFILAPSGKHNEAVLTSAAQGEVIALVCEGQHVGTITVDDIYPIDKRERVRQIYGTDDPSHPGISDTYKRLGDYAVSGSYTLNTTHIKEMLRTIKEAKEQINAQHTTALMLAVNPLHRAHERLIRQTLERSDLVVIFLLKPYHNIGLDFEIRHEALKYFVEYFLPRNRVVIVPLENSYIFAGLNELTIDAIVAKNAGCDAFMVGQNHAGLGMYYDHNTNKSILDRLVGIDITVEIASIYVYCEECKTLVSTSTCPHGQHHHISYNSNSILQLIELGLIPPAVLMRKEISALILSKCFPKRFENLQDLYTNILPQSGLLENHSEEEFYKELVKLYQTTSLT